MEFRRKLYPRGGSYETTVPKPLLFAMEDGKRYDVVYTYDPDTREWRIRIVERREEGA